MKKKKNQNVKYPDSVLLISDHIQHQLLCCHLASTDKVKRFFFLIFSPKHMIEELASPEWRARSSVFYKVAFNETDSAALSSFVIFDVLMSPRYMKALCPKAHPVMDKHV